MYYKCNAFDEAGRTCLYDNRMIMIANTTASIHDCQIEQHGHDLHKMYKDREISPFSTIHGLYLYYKCIAFDEAGGHAYMTTRKIMLN